MKPRLYKFHNTSLHFWLDPEEAESYNRFYETYREIPNPTTFVDFARATNVLAKVNPLINQAYNLGRIEELDYDKSVPLVSVN